MHRTADTAAGPHGEVTMLPMLARGPFTDLRGTPKFAHGHHQRVFQEATLVEIIQQRRIGAVKNWAMPILQQFEIKNMCVPTPVAVGREGFDVLAPVTARTARRSPQGVGPSGSSDQRSSGHKYRVLRFSCKINAARAGIRQQAVGALCVRFQSSIPDSPAVRRRPVGRQFLAILCGWA